MSSSCRVHRVVDNDDGGGEKKKGSCVSRFPLCLFILILFLSGLLFFISLFYTRNLTLLHRALYRPLT